MLYRDLKNRIDEDTQLDDVKWQRSMQISIMLHEIPRNDPKSDEYASENTPQSDAMKILRKLAATGVEIHGEAWDASPFDRHASLSLDDKMSTTYAGQRTKGTDFTIKFTNTEPLRTTPYVNPRRR